MFNFQELINSAFFRKRLNQKCEIRQNNILGKKLNNKRISQNIKIDEAEKAVNIQKKYLLAIEKGNYNKLPGQIYIKNFVKKYAKFLRLDVNICLEDLEREYFLFEHIKSLQYIKKRKNNTKIKKFLNFYNFHFLITPKFFKNIAIIAIFLLCFTYLGAEAKNIFNPPQIEIIYPPNNLVIEKQIITIKGRVEKGANVFINNKNVLTNIDGIFTENIILQSGINIIKITANKKYSKTNIIFRKILVVKE
ncbi:MAG: hypothetical protein GWO87_00070 [Xanthomonadaceae bacterium]|nr:hypothetical protein [Rhodospirillaceae bacterium]NIA17576.1 hypothetical protein [Xanthomonadaceae bacterium]